MKNINFGEAIAALEADKRVTRSSWGDDSLFVFRQIPATIGKDIVPKMQSLPQSVKDEFVRRFNDVNQQIDAIYYANQLAYVGLSNVISGYSPTVEDTLAEDWVVLD